MNHTKSERRVNHENTVSIRIWFTLIIIANESCNMKHVNIFLSERFNFKLIKEFENKSAGIQNFTLKRLEKKGERINCLQQVLFSIPFTN